MNKVMILMGATGIGKTEFSITLAKRYNFDIISADSVSVYKEFDIGSAKVKEEERQGIIHYGIDIVSPKENFSSEEFYKYTLQKIEEIHNKGKIPLIVGGTGLYIKSLVNGYNFGGVERHEEFRQKLEKQFEDEGIESLQRRLKELNESTYNSIDKSNKVRLIRAIEIETFGGSKTKSKTEYDFKIIALNMPREKLYERINQRTKKMIENGLIEETKYLYEKYGTCKPLNAIGYKETLAYLRNEIDLKRLEETISQHTRNYAKRQITFMKGIEGIKFVDVRDENQVKTLLKEIDEWIEEK